MSSVAGAAETENIPRQTEPNNETAAGDIVAELRELLGQKHGLHPGSRRNEEAGKQWLAANDRRSDG